MIKILLLLLVTIFNLQSMQISTLKNLCVKSILHQRNPNLLENIKEMPWDIFLNEIPQFMQNEEIAHNIKKETALLALQKAVSFRKVYLPAYAQFLIEDYFKTNQINDKQIRTKKDFTGLVNGILSQLPPPKKLFRTELKKVLPFYAIKEAKTKRILFSCKEVRRNLTNMTEASSQPQKIKECLLNEVDEIRSSKEEIWYTLNFNTKISKKSNEIFRYAGALIGIYTLIAGTTLYLSTCLDGKERVGYITVHDCAWIIFFTVSTLYLSAHCKNLWREQRPRNAISVFAISMKNFLAAFILSYCVIHQYPLLSIKA